LTLIRQASLLGIDKDTALVPGATYTAAVTLTRDLNDLEKLVAQLIAGALDALTPDADVSLQIPNPRTLKFVITPAKAVVVFYADKAKEMIRTLKVPKEFAQQHQGMVQQLGVEVADLKPKTTEQAGYIPGTQAAQDNKATVQKQVSKIEQTLSQDRSLLATYRIDQAKTETALKAEAPKEAAKLPEGTRITATGALVVHSPDLGIASIGALISAILTILVVTGIVTSIVMQVLGTLVIWYEMTKELKELMEGRIRGFVGLLIGPATGPLGRSDLTYDEAKAAFNPLWVFKPRNGVGVLNIAGLQATNDVGINSNTGEFFMSFLAWLPPKEFTWTLAMKGMTWPTVVPYYYVLHDYQMFGTIKILPIKWTWEWTDWPKEIIVTVPYTFGGRLLADGLAPAAFNPELRNLSILVTGLPDVTADTAYIPGRVDPDTGRFICTIRFPTAGRYSLTFATKYQSERAYTGQWIPPTVTVVTDAIVRAVRSKISIESPAEGTSLKEGETITLEGIAEKSARVVVYVGTKEIGQANIKDNRWSFVLESKNLALGYNTISVQAIEEKSTVAVIHLILLAGIEEKRVGFYIVFSGTYFKSGEDLHILIDTYRGVELIPHDVEIKVSGASTFQFTEDGGSSDVLIYLPEVKKGGRVDIAIIVRVKAGGELEVKTESVAVVG